MNESFKRAKAQIFGMRLRNSGYEDLNQVDVENFLLKHMSINDISLLDSIEYPRSETLLDTIKNNINSGLTDENAMNIKSDFFNQKPDFNLNVKEYINISNKVFDRLFNGSDLKYPFHNNSVNDNMDALNDVYKQDVLNKISVIVNKVCNGISSHVDIFKHFMIGLYDMKDFGINIIFKSLSEKVDVVKSYDYGVESSELNNLVDIIISEMKSFYTTISNLDASQLRDRETALNKREDVLDKKEQNLNELISENIRISKELEKKIGEIDRKIASMNIMEQRLREERKELKRICESIIKFCVKSDGE